MNSYVFSSPRLGFRNWTLDDLDALTKINNDKDVMEFFPFRPSKENTKEFILRMQKQYKEKGFCYFAVDIIETKEFAGFIGLSEQSYLENQEPFVDIGWRLKKKYGIKGMLQKEQKPVLNLGLTT